MSPADFDHDEGPDILSSKEFWALGALSALLWVALLWWIFA